MAALEICSRRIPSSLPRQTRGPAGPDEVDALLAAGDGADVVLEPAAAGESLAGERPSSRRMKSRIIWKTGWLECSLRQADG